jgi:hypothetical protein
VEVGVRTGLNLPYRTGVKNPYRHLNAMNAEKQRQIRESNGVMLGWSSDSHIVIGGPEGKGHVESGSFWISII